MRSRDFCFWLQGFFEIAEASGTAANFSASQVDCIRRHLAMVFKHEIDPETKLPEGATEAQQAAHQSVLDHTHGVLSSGAIMRC